MKDDHYLRGAPLIQSEDLERLGTNIPSLI